MASSKKHKRGLKKGLFCGVPGRPCECGNDYITVCKPHWHAFSFMRIIRRKLKPEIVFGKKYEAHHILCVSPVATELLSKPGIEGVIEATKWCINNKENMIGMPLWGHTVRWYCSAQLGGVETISPPGFHGIPQHDWDHNSKLGYTHEVRTELKDMAQVIKDAGHEVEPQDIKTALDNLSKEFRRRIETRGKRRGGTHVAWQSGGADRKWYEPFSMASTANLTKKKYPIRKYDARVARWIKKIAAAMAKGGA